MTEGVGALRKYAGGIFLASDLGGYAAVASIWSCNAHLKFSPPVSLTLDSPLPEGAKDGLSFT